jgi:hypothetical protein
MNERMELLMYHAGLTANGCWDQMGEYERKAIERFAKLIVKDCVELNKQELSFAAFERMQNLYTDHFGVEE